MLLNIVYSICRGDFMIKEEQGIVLEVHGNIAKVKAGRHSECKSCGACPGDKTIILDVQNPLGAKPGQKVCFEIIEINVLKAAYVVYIQPLVAALIGVFVGYMLATSFNQSVKWFQIIGGIIGFIISFVYIKIFDKNVNRDSNMQPTITKILS
jgi:sigma-E factor negative regulatory protein RseC